MNITIAVIFVKGVALTRVESECLVKCSDQSSGADIDIVRRSLEQAFSEIYHTSDIAVLFPELGEVIE